MSNSVFKNAIAIPPRQNLRNFSQVNSLVGYRPEIDGLRAIAVLAVILCHAQIALFAGGFVGVDIFFVISGFVVTSSILKDQQAKTFTLLGFYAGRLKRLAPSLYFVLGITLGFGYLFCFPEDCYDILKNIGFVALFYSNIYLSKQTGYFDPAADKQPLLHTWSLSVEEQFYLIFPLLLVALFKKNLRTKIGVFSILFFASLAYSHFSVIQSAHESYYYLHTRAFEFLAGALLTICFKHKQKHLQWAIQETMFFVGLLVILYSITAFNSGTPMPGIYALVPCIGTMLVIAGGAKAKLSELLLSNRVSLYVGKLSYVLYLWHWPILYAFRRLNLVDQNWMYFAMALTFMLSVVTHHVIEKPLRRIGWSNIRTVLLLLVGPIVVLGSLVALAKKTDNFAFMYPEKIRLDYQYAGHSVFKTSRGERCWNKISVTKAVDCTVGDPAVQVNAIYWGDSHAYQLIDFLDQIGKNSRLAIHDVTYSMCPPIKGGPPKAGNVSLQSHREACILHNNGVMEYVLANPQIKTVIMAAIWHNYTNGGSGPNATLSTHGFLPHEIDQRLAETIGILEAAGKHVVLIDDVPNLPPSLNNCASNKLYLPMLEKVDCSYAEDYAIGTHQEAKLILDGLQDKFPKVSMIHTYDVLCADGRCNSELYGVPLYYHNDVGHLGIGGSGIYYRAYKEKHPTELNSIFLQK